MIIQPNTDEVELLMATTGPRTQVVKLLIDEYYELLCNEYTHRGEAVLVDNSLVSTDLVPPDQSCLRTKNELDGTSHAVIHGRSAISVMLDASADDKMFHAVNGSIEKCDVTNPTALQKPILPSSVDKSDIGVDEKLTSGASYKSRSTEHNSVQSTKCDYKEAPPVAPKRNHRRSVSFSNESYGIESTVDQPVDDITLHDTPYSTIEQRKRELLNKVISIHDSEKSGNSPLLRRRSEKKVSRPRPVPQPRAISLRPLAMIDMIGGESEEEENGQVSEDELLLR